MTKSSTREVRAANVVGVPAVIHLRKGLAAALVLALSACGSDEGVGNTGGRPGRGGSDATGGATGGNGGATTGSGGATGGNGGATTGSGGATGGSGGSTGGSGGATGGSGGATGGSGGATGGSGGATGGSGGAAGATGGAAGATGGTGGSAGKADGGTTGGAGGSSGGASGAAGKGGTDGGAGTGGAAGTGGGGSVPPIPPPPATCPTIATGMISVLGQQVQIWTGPANTKGPMVFYWHGTGGQPSEAQSGLGPGLAEIQASGGVVASFSTSTAMGTNTGNNVWYTGDFAMADIILSCAVQQGIVDPRQVYTAGCSAGGLQVGAMVYERSSYLAAAMPNSGGTTVTYKMQDAHVPAMCSTHGGTGDVVIISFPDSTKKMNTDLRSKGGFVVNCDHGGSHCGSPAPVKAAQWKFLKAHPFGVSPEPYAMGLPADFPTTCTIVP
jgi:hypothetical protein